MVMYIEKTEFVAPELLSLQEVKKHLKIEEDFTEEDSLLQIYMEAAVSHLQSHLNRSVQNQQFEVFGCSFSDIQTFQKQTIISIDGIWFKGENGAYQLLNSDLYGLKKTNNYNSCLVYNGDLPTLQKQGLKSVKILVTCGFKKFPKVLKQALLLLVGDFYEYRTDRPKKSNNTVANLISTYKVY